MHTRGSSSERSPMTAWRQSRRVRLLAAVPLVGRLPTYRLIAAVQWFRRLRHFGFEYIVRAGAWLRTGQRWRTRGPSDAEEGCLVRGGVPRLFAPRTLRAFFHRSPIRRAHFLSAAAMAARPHSTMENPAARIRIAVYVSSEGNFFHAELAEVLARGLEASGAFEVQRRSETEEPAPDVDEHLVVAPHEFFELGRGVRFGGDAYRKFRRRCTLFLAEQPGTTHFVLCLPFAAEARLVLDLNPASADALKELGLRARFFPAGYVENLVPFSKRQSLPKDGTDAGLSFASARNDVAEGVGEDPRPIDILFTGVLTPRRAAFFSRHAAVFASKRCFFSLPTPHSPLRSGVPSALPTVEATALSQRAKIVLNIHRDRRPYFEWHRVVIRGFWQKAVVVSEPVALPPGFEAGVHLFEAELDRIPELLLWLLETEEGRASAERVREAAYQTFMEHYDMTPWAREMAGIYRASPRAV
jgi:hypothetical protein